MRILTEIKWHAKPKNNCYLNFHGKYNPAALFVVFYILIVSCGELHSGISKYAYNVV
jgi:hypothetical protein